MSGNDDFLEFQKLKIVNFNYAGDSLANQHVLDTFSHIVDIIDKCESVSDFAHDRKVDNTNDYIMDAQVLKMSHDLISNTTEKMANSEFREDEYLAALTDMLSSDRAVELVNLAIMCSKTIQFQPSMLGTFDLDAAPRQEKVKKARQTQKKAFGPKKAPENIKSIEKSEKGAEKINVMMSEIRRVCDERGTETLPYFEVIIDSQSFMKTVDAAFQIAFLVRDGKIGLKRVDGEPHLFLTHFEQFKNQTQNTIAEEQTVQTVMSINPKLWREEIEKYQLKKPLLRADDSEAYTNEHAADSSDSSD